MSGHKTKLKNRRSDERKAVELPGTLIFDDSTEPCTIFDISPRGAKVSACHRAPLDQPIRLKLTERGEFIARVAWRNGDCMGLEFLHLGDDISYPAELSGPDVHLVS